MRLDQPADADHEAAEHRPPHPMNRQALEEILAGIDHLRQQPRGETGDDAESDRQQ
jgi:hypothetical protein